MKDNWVIYFSYKSSVVIYINNFITLSDINKYPLQQYQPIISVIFMINNIKMISQ